MAWRRGQGRSPLKYTNCGVCMFYKDIYAKFSKKVLPCQHFEGHHLLTFGLYYEGPINKFSLLLVHLQYSICTNIEETILKPDLDS
jgi:hypothetical protein